MDNIIENNVNDIVDTILNDYTHDRTIDKMKLFTQPDRYVIIKIIENLMKIMYPGYFRDTTHKIYIMENSTRVLIEDTLFRLNKQIELALKYSPDYENADDCELHVEAQRLTVAFFHTLPKVRALLETDLQAAFDGDPAAYSKEEVILSYPGLQAITINRLAHELFLLNVPLIPRIMTEYAHSTTGIDIHPGATIGEYFFIDHGTGIVVGETTTIGDHVKIYQGVTLGALSTKRGQMLKGNKRHPTIGNNVTIYSNTSVLGGDTIIGDDVTIGGNAFITSSISAGMKVNAKNPELQYSVDKNHKPDDGEFWDWVI
jgi:serine O-acetyltransferase